MEFITLMLAFAVLEETELASNGTQSLFYTKPVIALQEELQIPSDTRGFCSSFTVVFAVEQEHSCSWDIKLQAHLSADLLQPLS